MDKERSHQNYLKYRSKRKEKYSIWNQRIQENRRKIKIELFTLLGNKCSNPFNIDHSAFEQNLNYFKVLQIDHINGGGKKEILITCRVTYYKRVLERVKAGSKDYQILCPTCNWIKRITNKEI